MDYQVGKPGCYKAFVPENNGFSFIINDGDVIMTIDKSLKIKKGVSRSRNVLTRVERIEKLQAMDRWAEDASPFNLPKVRVFKVVLKKKKKAKEEGDAAAAPAAKGGKK